MRSMVAASASAASLPDEGGATTTLAPSVRNSCVNFCSASRLIFSSAEEIAAPLESAIRATVSRPRLARSSCRKILQNMDRERGVTSSLTPQYGRRIDARCVLKRHQAAEQRHDGGQHEHNGEEDPSNGGSDAENSNAEDSRQLQTDGVARNSANERQEELLGKKKQADRAAARAQGLHQSNFRTPLKNGSRGRGAYGRRRREQRSERDQPHQAAHPREDSAFSLGDLPNRADFDPRKFLLHLVRNRGNVWAAVPAVVICRRHFGGIALGERVRRLGQSAHQQAAIAAGTAGKVLRNLERREDSVVFAAAGRNDACNGQRERVFPGADCDRVPHAQACTVGKPRTDE